MMKTKAISRAIMAAVTEAVAVSAAAQSAPSSVQIGAADSPRKSQVIVDITGRTTTKFQKVRLPKAAGEVSAMTEVKLSAKAPVAWIVDGSKRISSCRPTNTKTVACTPVVSKKNSWPASR